MPGLYESLVNGTFDMQNKRDMSSDFARELLDYRDDIVDKYIKHGISLNKSIADLARSKNLTDEQIKRIVEECNNQIYLIKYSKLKSEPERNVNFEIADFKKIKGKEDEEKRDKNSDSDKEKNAFSLSESLEKTASLNYKEPGNCYFDFSMPSPTLKAEKETGLDEIILSKMADEVERQSNDLEKISHKLSDSLGVVSNAIINLDKLGADTSDLFSKISVKNSISSENQSFIKEAIEKTIDSYKETNMYPVAKNIELKITDYTPYEFGLGEYSLCKEATEDMKLPAISIGDKLVDSIGTLTSLFNDADKAINDFKKVSCELNEKKELLKEAFPKFDYEAIEKVAGSKNNFFNALLGVTKKNTSRDLHNAKKELDALRRATKGFDSATQKVNTAKHNLDNLDSQSALNFGKNAIKDIKSKREFMKQQNKRILDEGNFFQRSKINREINNLNKQEKMHKDNLNHLKNQMNNRFTDDLNKANAELNFLKNKSGIADAESKVNKQQEAYKKALRQTKASRFAAGGVATLGGATLFGNKKQKQNNDFNNDYNNKSYLQQTL